MESCRGEMGGLCLKYILLNNKQCNATNHWDKEEGGGHKETVRECWVCYVVCGVALYE